MKITDKPTPRYDEVVKEAKWVNARVIEFANKYPGWSNYLESDHVVWKAQVDYQMSLSDRPSERRSYHSYFNRLYYDIVLDKDENDKEVKKQIEKLRKAFDSYYAIRQCIINNLVPYYRNQALCGCVKCHHNDFAEKFTRKMPFICRRCRKIIRIWKDNLKWRFREGGIIKAEYEAKSKAGCPERYFLTIKEIKANPSASALD